MLDSKARTLLILAQTGSYTKTARRLHLTQPAVSHHIRLLENEYGIKIFKPDKKELKFTQEGRILHRYARQMYEIESRALRAVADSLDNLKHLTVGITQTAGENLIPQTIAQYCSEHPHTSVSICTDTPDNLYRRMSLYELDIAIVEGSDDRHPFESILLDTDRLCLIFSPQHPFARFPQIRLDDLKDEKLILRSGNAGTRVLFENYLLKESENIKNFQVVMEIDNLATIKDLVAMNYGISIVADSACRSEIRSGKLASAEIDNARMIRDISMVYDKDFTHTEILEDLKRIYLRLSSGSRE